MLSELARSLKIGYGSRRVAKLQIELNLSSWLVSSYLGTNASPQETVIPRILVRYVARETSTKPVNARSVVNHAYWHVLISTALA
tara:strand:+ start:14025 stop:14279 length:255 start_codon:yes stop_codon:yes gene_type:complete